MQIRRRNERQPNPFEPEPDHRIGERFDALQKYVADVNDRQKCQQARKGSRNRIAKIIGKQIEEQRKRDDDDRGRKDDIAEGEE